MVAYSFQKRFVEPITSGLKCQTIRNHRRGRARHVRPGEDIQLYTGMRTKYCTLIGVRRCIDVRGINIQLGYGIISVDDYPAIRDGDADAFAQCDGFKDWDDMRAFWAQHHPGVFSFDGVLIKWEAIT